MTMPSAKMWVSVGEKFACLKIAGRANFTSSIDFKAVIDELVRKGYCWFLVDLTDCQLMDSTFLGVLAGLGLRMNASEGAVGAPTFELFNPNARIVELLENLGILHLFKISEGEAAIPGNATAEPRELNPASPTRDEVKLNCLEAHRTLMQLHPENVSKFKELTQFLAEDLKQLKQPSQR